MSRGKIKRPPIAPPSEKKETKPKSPIISKREKEPDCACVKLTYADGRVELEPCDTHLHFKLLNDKVMQLTGALNEAAEGLAVYANVILAYRILAEGCPRHRDYRATKKPVMDCRKGCHRMWRVRLWLDKQHKGFLKRFTGFKPIHPEPEDLEVQAGGGAQDLLESREQGNGEPFVPTGVSGLCSKCETEGSSLVDGVCQRCRLK